jgi:hypothetical protein
MSFFLSEILARIIAVYLLLDCGRILWRGFVERKIKLYSFNYLTGATEWMYHRDAMPVRYWMMFGAHTLTMLACLFIAIFGWR